MFRKILLRNITIIFVTALLVACSPDQDNAPTSGSSETPLLPIIPLDKHPFIGSDSDIRRGAAFQPAPPDENLKSAEWSALPVTHEPGHGKVDLAVAVDQQEYPVLVPLISRFAKDKGIKIAVADGTCGVSAGLLSRKAVDIGGFCCPAGVNDRLPGLQFHTLGIVGIALFVHPENPVNDISLQQARDIFSKANSNWNQLTGAHGNSASIDVVTRLHCKTRPGHWKLLLGQPDIFSSMSQDTTEVAQMIRSVADNHYAIGYETLQMAARELRQGKVKALTINGLAPDSAEALIKGYYPLYRTFQLTTWDGVAANPLAKELVEYLIDQVSHLKWEDAYMVDVEKLRRNGWKFQDQELVGEPGSQTESM